MPFLVDRPRAAQKAPPPSMRAVERYAIPQELRLHDAWAAWRYDYEAQRWSKPPFTPDGRRIEHASDPATWSSFDDAYRAYQDRRGPDMGRPFDGVSFALDPRWGIVGVDLDHISEHRAAADAIVRTLNSYTELSPSGDGYRIFLRGQLPDGRRRRDWVEMYNARRFLTVTGHRLEGAPEHLQTSPHLYSVWDRWLNRSR